MNKSMVVFDPGEFEYMQRMAKAMVESGYFKDAADIAKAVVKIQAGKELGLPPFASMTGVHIIQGKPVLGSQVVATLVKNDPRYNYTVESANDKMCVIRWWESGEIQGVSEFTIEEAKKAGLTNKDNWKKYPSDMLFARAISRGAKRFAPGVFGGSPVYTADELGVEVDPDGNIVDGEVKEVYTQTEEPKPEVVNGNRPYPPHILKAKIEERSRVHATKMAPDHNRNILGKMLKTTFEGDDTKRYEFSKWLFTESSVKNIPDAYIWAAFDWLGVSGDDFNDVPNEHAIAEVNQALPIALKEQGQAELL